MRSEHKQKISFCIRSEELFSTPAIQKPGLLGTPARGCALESVREDFCRDVETGSQQSRCRIAAVLARISARSCAREVKKSTNLAFSIQTQKQGTGSGAVFFKLHHRVLYPS